MALRPGSSSDLPIVKRLTMRQYSLGDPLAAIRGERIPTALGMPLIRLCVIRGIRYHDDFAIELYGVLPEFSRALNARMIMSNKIPDLGDVSEAELPYCIWHPNVASESTYRNLAQRYPRMSYQVARACAVAGYTELYLELNVLPEVHVAEEARECGNTAIFELIMAAPARYSVMNDYNRTITTNPALADLNGDTSVRWMLDIKQGLQRSYGEFSKSYFNITEDMNIDEKEASGPRSTVDLQRILTEPLGRDLPTVDKDLLILMAAYTGNIDRYARLRRPNMIAKEIECCVHGIYHHTLFALWWSKQKMEKVLPTPIRQAICARFIMNNVLSPHIVGEGDSNLPTLISVPSLAQESTYRALVKYKPSMVFPVLQACIKGEYMDLFNELITTISKADLENGLKKWSIQKEPFYEIVRKRWDELKCSPEFDKTVGEGSRERFELSHVPDLEISTVEIPPCWGIGLVETYFSTLHPGRYMNGHQCDVGRLELLVSLPDEWKAPEDREVPTNLDYIDWPPNWEETSSLH